MALNSLILICLLTVLAVARVASDPPLDATFELNTTNWNDGDDGVTTFAGEDKWTLSVQRGAKLLQGMKADDRAAAALYGLGETAESPYDGDLRDTLASWGYNDNTEAMQKLHDKDCDMENGNKVKKCFDELGLGTKSKAQGGPNECFQLEHYDSPAVILKEDGSRPSEEKQTYKAPCGTIMRMTGAANTVGINAAGGAVIAIDIISSARAATSLWRPLDPKTEDLPHIRSFSDITWAFWNRAAAGNIQGIKYFMATMVINRETNQHIRKALSELTPLEDGIKPWPGHEFSMDLDAGKALLGAPVGRWAGYFLMQHKRQLGGSKVIDKVRVFASDKGGSFPYLVFHVGRSGEVAGAEEEALRSGGGGVCVKSRVVSTRKDGRNVLREHVFHAAK